MSALTSQLSSKKKPLAYTFLELLPRKLFSRLCGWVADLPLPAVILRPMLHVFIAFYRIDMKEYLYPIARYKNFTEFFTRPLKPGMRPVNLDADALVSPVDGTLGEYGSITQQTLIQAKGHSYSLRDLLGDAERAASYEGGTFITIYLAPNNYHRIHSMADGEIADFSYFPGDLWTVSPLGVQYHPNLFARNERTISYLQTSNRECALVKVGATVVGRIKVPYHSIVSNKSGAVPVQEKLSTPFVVKRGEEVGRFELGSTVICLFPENQVELNDFREEQVVRMGERIGTFHY